MTAYPRTLNLVVHVGQVLAPQNVGQSFGVESRRGTS